MKLFFLFTLMFVAFSISSSKSQIRPLIIDHNCTQLDKIPANWTEQAKTKYKVGYGHKNHGRQIVTGIQLLDTIGSIYRWDEFGGKGSDGTQFLRFKDGFLDGHLGIPDWTTKTKTFLALADNKNINMIMWSWDGSVKGATEISINTYLSEMSKLESQYPTVTFIYMTGQTDGTGEDGNLNIRNNQIREYCISKKKVLFDYADMEAYNPDGDYFLNKKGTGDCSYEGGNWADEWCAANPDKCATCTCDYSRSVLCQLKGNAFWWMIAQLAGWGGDSEKQSKATFSPDSLKFGDVTQGHIADGEMTIKNDGDRLLRVNKIEILYDKKSSFSIRDSVVTPFFVNAKSSRTIPIRFIPTALGVQSAYFYLNSDAGNGDTQFMVLHGKGIQEVSVKDNTENNSMELRASPNPFNGNLSVELNCPKDGLNKIEIYLASITGYKITTLTDDIFSVGKHLFNYNIENLSNGLYFIVARSNKETKYLPVILNK